MKFKIATIEAALIERWKGASLELGFIAILSVWTSVAAIWLFLFDHTFVLNAVAATSVISSVIEAKDYLIPKCGVLMLISGLIVNKLHNGIGRVLATLGLLLLLVPCMLVASAITTDSKFVQFVVPVVCLSLPIAIAALITSLLLPKAKKKQPSF